MLRYNVLTLVVLAVIYSVAAQNTYPPLYDCPPDEVYSRCGKMCEPTCSDPNSQNSILCQLIVCLEPLTGGCRCMDGYVRSQPGVCIPAANCTNS